MQVKILPSRQVLVDRIELQYEYGQSIVTLLGGPGLGKSYILESFVTDKYSEFNKIYLQLTLKTTDQQVISQLLEQTFSQPLIDFSHSLSENYLSLNDQQTSENTVIVIDNAQFLSEELTHEIEYLTQIAESTFFVLTASTSKIHFQNSANIYFEALSFDESIELMSMYFSQLPNKHEPVFKAFVESAQGNPSLLLSWDSNSAIEETKKGKHGFMLMCLAFVVLMTLALSYLFEYLSQSNQIENLRELNVQNLEQSTQIDKLNNIKDKEISKSIENHELDNIQAQVLEISSKDNKLDSINEEDQKQNSEVIKVIHETQKVMEADASNEQKVEISKLSNVDAFDDSNKISKPNLKNGSATPNKIAESLNNTKTEPAKYTELTPLTTVVKTETQSLKKIIVNDAELTTSVTNYDNAWFMHQSDSLVMLQLIGVSQENLINNFISTHNLNNIKIYQSTRYGGDWWVVTVGPFKDIPQSQAYKNALSTQLKQLQPFSKTIKAIKTEIALLKLI